MFDTTDIDFTMILALLEMKGIHFDDPYDYEFCHTDEDFANVRITYTHNEETERMTFRMELNNYGEPVIV